MYIYIYQVVPLYDIVRPSIVFSPFFCFFSL